MAPRRLCPLGAVPAVLLSAAAAAAAGASVEVRFAKEWAESIHGGYWPLMVGLTNRGEPVEGVVELVSTSSMGSPVEITRPVSLGRGESSTIWLPVPAEEWSRYSLQFVAGGRRFPRKPPSIGGPSRIHERMRAVIAVDSLAPDLRQLDAALSSGGRGSVEAAHVRPERLPSTWQPYSSIGLCVIHARALAGLTPTQLQALRRWIFAGGTCVVHATGARAAAAAERMGITATGLTSGKARPPDVERVGCGLGEWLLVKRDVFPGEEAWWRTMLARTSPGLGSRVVKAAAGRFQIPGVGTPPVKAFVVISILFVILIGPVNWYVVLYRMKKQALFLLTTPAIAVVTSVLMLTYSFVSEGFGTHTRIESLALVDLASRRGVTWSRHAVYAALPPRGGLRFDPSTLVLPVKIPEGPRSVSWHDGQRLTSGWLPARTYTRYVTCAHYPARWRVEIDRDGNGYAITNGLPRGLSELVVKTEDGTYGTDRVDEGARAVLAEVRPLPRAGVPRYFAKAFGLQGESGDLLAQLRPGSFVARLDGPLGAEIGLEGYSEEQGSHYVIGIAGAQAASGE